jgi:hypothetical protein
MTMRLPFASSLVVSLLPLLVACGAKPPPRPAGEKSANSAAASPGPDDAEHAEAVARLATAPWTTRLDKRRTISFPLPDGDRWTHVKFWGVTTLAGWRYGDDHHAVSAAFTFESTKSKATVDSCARRFLAWGARYAKAFDLEISKPRVDAAAWLGSASGDAGQGNEVRIYVLDAERRSVFGARVYRSAFAVYPAWSDACLVVGVSVPEDEAGENAAVVRDKIVRDAFPGLVAKPGKGPLALEAKIDIDE